MIEPILLYGCEVWGFEDLKSIERIHLKFCKRILNVRTSTPSFMIYGELGRYPLDIRVKLRMLSYWSKLVNSSKLGNSLYQLMLKVRNQNHYNFRWINFIESVLNNTGLGHIFINQSGFVEKAVLSRILQDQFIAQWYSDMANSSRGQFYGLFKTEFSFEHYLTKLQDNSRLWITKLRLSNLHIPIETGRWKNIPRENRKCPLCCTGDIGNEFHYLFICPYDYLVTQRCRFIPEYYMNNPNIVKMIGLFSICNVELYKRLSIFIKKIASLF